MLECSSCYTLNPDSASACLVCGVAFARPGATPVGMVRCPAGHPVDPSWKSCPYCDRAPAPPAGSTRRDGEVLRPAPPARPAALPPFAVQPAPRPAAAPPPATRLEEEAPARGGRQTVLQEGEPTHTLSPAAIRAAAEAAAGRLVGVLAAPELGGAGAIFPLRAGKTTLGAASNNQVTVTGDPQVSSEHAVILYRDGIFHLSDRLSTNGCWVNGLEVPANGTVTLRDRDRLRFGNTRFVLLILDAASPNPAVHS